LDQLECELNDTKVDNLDLRTEYLNWKILKNKYFVIKFLI
jgi:hypothetical protein